MKQSVDVEILRFLQLCYVSVRKKGENFSAEAMLESGKVGKLESDASRQHLPLLTSDDLPQDFLPRPLSRTKMHH